MSNHKKCLPFLASALILASCKSTGGDADLKDAAIGPGLTESLTLDKETAQELYLLMLKVETNSGAMVPKDQLHSSRGVALCRSDAGLESCQAFVRLATSELAAPQPLPEAQTDVLFKFAKKARPELEKEGTWLTDLACDYLGKKSPPYAVEDVGCRLELPRTTKEAVFTEPTAVELAEALRGEAQSFSDNGALVSGSLACRFQPDSDRVACMVRATSNGVLGEKVTEVSGREAPGVARKMLEAALDHARLAKGQKEVGKKPTEVTGALVCLVEAGKEPGSRKYHCRAAL